MAARCAMLIAVGVIIGQLVVVAVNALWAAMVGRNESFVISRESVSLRTLMKTRREAVGGLWGGQCAGGEGCGARRGGGIIL